MATLTITSNSLSDTNALAGCFSSCLTQGLVVGLNGPLGAGKSAFARFVIQSACDDVDDVPSPTFTLVQSYETASHLPIWHMDLYRLDEPEEVFALGVEDAFFEAACLVEWPERMGGYWPDNALSITFQIAQEDSRIITLEGDEAVLHKLAANLAQKAPHLIKD